MRSRCLGIDNDTHGVAYDTPGLYSAARVWWLFRRDGYDQVSILDGGLKAWKTGGRPVEAGDVEATPAIFKAGQQRDLYANWQHVLSVFKAGTARILDPRTPGRFAGTEVDRYPGARPGDIPTNRNLYAICKSPRVSVHFASATVWWSILFLTIRFTEGADSP